MHNCWNKLNLFWQITLEPYGEAAQVMMTDLAGRNNTRRTALLL